MAAKFPPQEGHGAGTEPQASSGVEVAGAGGGAAVGTGAGARGATAAPNDDDTRRRIRSRIVQHKRYPALARRRGIEGTVTLSLAVRADGSVDVSVVHSADPTLDEAAREAVLAAAPLPAISGRLEIELHYHVLDP